MPWQKSNTSPTIRKLWPMPCLCNLSFSCLLSHLDIGLLLVFIWLTSSLWGMVNRWEFPLGLVSEKLSHDCLRGMSSKMTISLSKKIWECCSSQMAMLSVLPVCCSSLSWLLGFGGLLLSVLLKHHDVPSMTTTQVEMSEVCVLGVWLLGCINFLRVSLFGESLLKLFWRE